MAEELFGNVKNPLPQINPLGSYGGVKTGLPAFISNLIGLIAVIGGIALLINFLLAGISFISAAGDPKKVDQAWQKISVSFTGFVIIVAAFILVGIIGKIFFGDYTALLKPKLFGPGANTLTP